MESKTLTIRVPKRWARVSLIVGVTALIVAPLTAVASHIFNDVPDSHTFHSDIAWLADAGVTKGCNPPDNTEFCPDDNVTRGQMAAFMHRLADNRVVDAGTVEGLTSDGIATVSGTRGAGTIQVAVPYETATTIEEITSRAPTDGYLSIQADASYRLSSNLEIIQWLQLDDTTCEAAIGVADSVDLSYTSLSADANRQTASNSAVVPVDEGNHTLTLCVRTSDGPGTPQLGGTSLSAIFFASGKVEEPLLP